MISHKLTISDDAISKEEIVGVAPQPTVICIVTSDNGIFKRGQHYHKGDTIKLDIQTAKNLAANGDVKGELNE